MAKFTTEQLKQKYNVPTEAEVSTTTTPTAAPTPGGKMTTDQLMQKYQQPQQTALQSRSLAKSPTADMSVGQKALEVGKGVVKGGIGTVVDAMQMGDAFANQTAGRVVSAITGKGFKPLSVEDRGGGVEVMGSEKAKETEDKLKASNNYQKAGKVAEFVGEIALPAGALKNLAMKTPLAIRAAEKAIATRQAKISNVIGRVLQGETKDVDTGRKALQQIDTQGVKTYKDLQDRLDERIGIISGKIDETLDTDKLPRILSNLSLETTVGGQKVAANYVDDALKQVEEFYTKTKNVQGAAKIAQLREKANTVGLTVREVNELARLHGRELSAFNASGELASGLSKQAAENTRKGLKATVLDRFGNKITRDADAELTSLIRTRDLAKEMTEKVNDLKQKVQPRSLGNRVGRLLEQALNIASLGTTRGFVQALIPRGQGLKVLNALDLEKQLQKNLKLIEKAADPKASETDIVKALEEFIANNGQKPVFLLPGPGQTSRAADSILYAGEKGAASKSLQEASDVAAVQSGRIKPPKATKPRGVQDFAEPYARENELPIIEFGKKPKKPKSDLPTIR